MGGCAREGGGAHRGVAFAAVCNKTVAHANSAGQGNAWCMADMTLAVMTTPHQTHFYQTVRCLESSANPAVCT